MVGSYNGLVSRQAISHYQSLIRDQFTDPYMLHTALINQLDRVVKKGET